MHTYMYIYLVLFIVARYYEIERECVVYETTSCQLLIDTHKRPTCKQAHRNQISFVPPYDERFNYTYVDPPYGTSIIYQTYPYATANICTRLY